MIIVRVLNNLPTKTRGLVVQDEDGNYNIYINANHTCEQNKITFKHEMKHIKRKHLQGHKNASRCEEEILG